MYTVLLVVHTLLVLFLIVLVLIQRSESDGLGGLGGGGNQFLSGRSQANLLTRMTAILAGAFMITSLTLAIMANNMSGRSIVDTIPEQTAPVETKKETPAANKEVTKEKKAPAVPKPE